MEDKKKVLITGSNPNNATKELIASLLEQGNEVVAVDKNTYDGLSIDGVTLDESLGQEPIVQSKAKPKIKWLAGPFNTNRKLKRTFMSKMAARNKKKTAFKMGFRGNAPVGYPEHIGIN